MSDTTSALAVQYVRLIAEQLDRMEVQLDQWLALSDLTVDELAEESLVIDLERFRKLSVDALRLSGQPALGLMVGEGLGIQAHGALGYAAMSSRTIREVLELIQRYIGVRIAVVAMTVEASAGAVRVLLHEPLPLGAIRAMVLEGALCSIKGVLDDVSMGACEIQGASFPFPDPGYAAQAAAILRCPVRYGQPAAGLTLSPRILDLPLKTSDPLAFRHAEELCRRELRAIEASRSWVARVQRILLEQRVGFPSLEETARRLHVTPRTLHRRLVEEDSAFRVILDDLRRRSSMEQLSAGDASVEEVAYILGYSDPANFRRAFRRWTGVPPTRFRATALEHRGEGTHGPTPGGGPFPNA